MNFLDFFAGIGGFRTGLERVGGICKGFAEIDKYARQSYKAMHDTEGELEWHDITAVTDDDFRRLRGTIDLIAGGFPCQAFSVAGKRMGFDESRGTLFFHIARAAKEIQPRYLLLENVKGLVSHDQGRTLTVILNTLQELGYGHIEWGIFNSKFWGVPQNRERIFIVAERVSEPQRPYLLDLLKQQEDNGVQTRLRDVLETNVDEKYYLSDEKTKNLIRNLDKEVSLFDCIDSRQKSADKIRSYFDSCPTLTATEAKDVKKVVVPNTEVVADLNHYGNDQMNRVYGVDGQAPTIIAVSGGRREPKIAEPIEVRAVLTPDRHGVMFGEPKINVLGTTMTTEAKGTNSRQWIYEADNSLSATIGAGTYKQPMQIFGECTNYRVRKLTPLECWRLQGFSDELHKASVDSGVSDSQRYKQAGNSVTVNVIEVIGAELQKRMC